jgi:sarcosine oxidase gamma subunit
MADALTRRTALFEAHLEARARMVEFAGWEMPVQYAGVRAESLGVRQGCGLFDVSHMGQIDVRGPDVGEALSRVVSADWSKVQAGRASYALLLNESGGVLDDIMGYHLSPNHWLVVANASRAHVDEEFLRHHLPPEIEVSNRYANQAMIAIQGPRAQELLDLVCEADLETFAFRDVRASKYLGRARLWRAAATPAATDLSGWAARKMHRSCGANSSRQARFRAGWSARRAAARSGAAALRSRDERGLCRPRKQGFPSRSRSIRGRSWGARRCSHGARRAKRR